WLQHGRLAGAAAQAFARDGPQHAKAVADGVEVAFAVQARALEARHLGHAQAGPGHADVDDRLDLEAVAPLQARAGYRAALQVERRQAVPPERVVAVAQVTEPGAVERVGEQVQPEVAGPADPRDVGTAAAVDEARALRVVGAGQQRGDERRDLPGIGRAVRVDHHDDVAP